MITDKVRAAQLIAATKHGAYNGGKETPEHYIWRSMIQRCCNPQNKSWKYYGQRGIEICEAWFDYEIFLADVGPRPSPKHTLDRVDNDGDYEPGNVRWVTRKVQQNNRTNSKLFEHNGQTLSAMEWAAKLGISYPLAHWRWKNWGTFERGKTWKEIAP